MAWDGWVKGGKSFAAVEILTLSREKEQNPPAVLVLGPGWGSVAARSGQKVR